MYMSRFSAVLCTLSNFSAVRQSTGQQSSYGVNSTMNVYLYE